MFHQNSNDLVKNASVRSGHVQNSSGTRDVMMKELPSGILVAGGHDTGGGGSSGSSGSSGANESLSIGTKFQNMIQGLIDSVSLKEGIDGAAGASAPTPANPSSGISGGGGGGQTQFVNNIAKQNAEHGQQELDHIERSDNIMKLIDTANKNSRQKWVEVTDSAGVTKYGYITKDGIFQIWHAPPSPSANPLNWFQTEPIKKNIGVLGCPAAAGSIQKHKIAGTWETIKPFDMVYAHDDSGRKNPLFLLVNDAVRDPKNSMKRAGLFSCGNERGNVYVSQRPSADFQFTKEGDAGAIQMGCYVIAPNVKDSDIANRGFTFQDDLTEASISQCKRRAEDLGSSYFLVSAPQYGKPNNRGGCWIYTGSGIPKIEGILTLDETAAKCHTVGNPEVDEDGFMKAYTTTNLKRLYGKNTAREESVALYALKSGGPTGVDTTDRNGRGYIGRIAYIDHNGERHDYPASALSFMAPSKNAKGETLPASYVNLGGYDTRSAESSYGLKEITPGSFSDVANLLYKASRDGWTPQKFHQLCDNKGPTYTRAIINDGRVLGAYTSLSWASGPGYQNDTTAFLYDGTRKYTAEKGHWGAGVYATYMNSSYYPTFGGGHDLYISGTTMYTNAYSFVSGNELLAPFTRKIQMANMYGPAIGREIPTEIKFLNDGRVVYVCYDSPYTKLVTADGQEKYYDGAVSQFNPSNWNSYKTVGYKGAYRLNLLNQFKEVPRQGWGGYQQYTLQDIEVYSVDANTFPKTNPPDYARRLRTMPVGESITASMEKCRGICDADEKCGGFVYTKSGSSADGKCELKDRTKMYPIGLRVADPTKQLMLKVPTINGTIRDEACKAGGGGSDPNGNAYTTIDSAQYAHYPDTGAMTGGTKCNVKNMIPKKGSLEAPDITPMFGAVDAAFKETEDATAEYRAQTTVSESFTGFREGMAGTINSGNYADTMKEVQGDLTKIANSEYQRERLIAMTEETNKVLIAESYKFILWSILAILAVMALLKLKEMFGQDDVDAAGEGGAGDGGLFAYILGLFGIGSVKTDDIADRTGDVKEALSSAGAQLKEVGEGMAAGITEGADNLVASANEVATGAVEGAMGLADKVSETATDAVNKVGDAIGSAGASGTTGAGTGGGRGGRSIRIGGNK
jgi:hypothetical protein